MKNIITVSLGIILGALPAIPASAQPASTIENTADTKYAYGANIGWINMRPDRGADGGNGVTVRSTYLEGRVYSANCGWITIGKPGGPANGHTYTNADETDYGVNLDGNALRGYAYGANIGWINFGMNYPAAAQDDAPVIDYKTGEMSGYAWGANVGWINLGDPAIDFHVVTATIDRPDDDSDGIDDIWERLIAGNINILGLNNDEDGDGYSDVDEYLSDTDAMDTTDHFRILSYTPNASNSNTDIEFTSSASRCYQLFYKDDLGAANWTAVFNDKFNGQPVSTLLSNVDTNYPNTTQRFWLVEANLPLEN
jgi:hypothetical protein